MVLSKKTQLKIRQYLNSGFSKRKISKILGISKNTVIKYSGLKGYYCKPIKHFQVRYSKEDGEVVGIFVGDGSQYFEPKSYSYEITIHIGKHNLGYLTYVKKLFETHFNKNLWILKDSKCFKLRTKSKALFQYFSDYLFYDSRTKHSTVHLKTLNLPKDFKIGFIRGLFDTDGSIKYGKERDFNYVVYCSTSKRLSKQVQCILKEVGIKHSLSVDKRPQKGYKDCYVIKIYKESIIPFISLIKPFKAKGLVIQSGQPNRLG